MTEQETVIPVTYVDDDNYKESGGIICSGQITDDHRARLKQALHAGTDYVPEQLGMTCIGYLLGDGQPRLLWQEMDVDAGYVVDRGRGIPNFPETAGDIEGFVSKVEAAAAAGWNPDPGAYP